MDQKELLLEIKDLHTSFRIRDDYFDAVDGVNMKLFSDEILAIVGESGCGKSTLATTIMGLHSSDEDRKKVKFCDQNAAKKEPCELNLISRQANLNAAQNDEVAYKNANLKAKFGVRQAAALAKRRGAAGCPPIRRAAARPERR